MWVLKVSIHFFSELLSIHILLKDSSSFYCVYLYQLQREANLKLHGSIVCLNDLGLGLRFNLLVHIYFFYYYHALHISNTVMWHTSIPSRLYGSDSCSSSVRIRTQPRPAGTWAWAHTYKQVYRHIVLYIQIIIIVS